MNVCLRTTLHVTAEWITSYAESIGAPKQLANGVLIAPSTMPIVFWQEFDIPGMEQEQPVIHGDQQFLYERPVVAGMTLDCELSLLTKEHKKGRQGPLTLFTYMLVCSCGGQPVVTSETVLIRKEAGVPSI